VGGVSGTGGVEAVRFLEDRVLGIVEPMTTGRVANQMVIYFIKNKWGLSTQQSHQNINAKVFYCRCTIH
jgi:hypothetical protein